jgi:5-methylthioribose kinase
MEYYNFPDGFDQRKLAGFAGTEILRRLIGVAQLPLSLTLTEKVQTMERAADWIRSGNLNIIA